MRKDIWDYFLKNYKHEDLEYGTFLKCINQFVKEGKVEKNDNGYFWVNKDLYEELHVECINDLKQSNKANKGGPG